MSLTGALHKLFRQGRGGRRGWHTTTVHSTPRPSSPFPPRHNNWPFICDAQAPMTAFGQHSLVPAFYATRASVAPRYRTACTAREAPSHAEWDTNGSMWFPSSSNRRTWCAISADLRAPSGPLAFLKGRGVSCRQFTAFHLSTAGGHPPTANGYPPVVDGTGRGGGGRCTALCRGRPEQSQGAVLEVHGAEFPLDHRQSTAGQSPPAVDEGRRPSTRRCLMPAPQGPSGPFRCNPLNYRSKGLEGWGDRGEQRLGQSASASGRTHFSGRAVLRGQKKVFQNCSFAKRDV